MGDESDMTDEADDDMYDGSLLEESAMDERTASAGAAEEEGAVRLDLTETRVTAVR